MNNATRAQGMQHLKLIEDQGLDLKQSDIINLYLPALAAGIKKGSIPPLGAFRSVCEGRANPKSLEQKWTEEKEVIYFTLPSTDGTDAEGWITRLELQGFKPMGDAKGVLLAGELKPTTGVVYPVAVIRGTAITDEDRITHKIQAEGANRKWKDLPLEAVCLIREMFSDKDLKAMGLYWIVGMTSKPVQFRGGPRFLGADRDGGGSGLDAGWAGPDGGWNAAGGFAFRVPQVQSST